MTTFAEGKARNLALNSQGTIASTLDGANPSIYGYRPEYIPINIGNSVSLGETVRLTVSFDLVMTVATANPTLQVYNTNNKGPMQLASVNALAGETHAVGETISKRVAVTANWAPRSDANKQTNWLEFYSTYGTGNYFSISNLMVELGEVAHPWRAAPEDSEGASDMILATDTKTLAVAVDVQQVDTYYYQTASTGTAPSKPTAASPSGWQTAEYAFDASKAVWSCQKTTLTDGTFYWGAVSKWSAYEGSVVAWNKANAAQESIDNLEVGGRNLLPVSSFIFVSAGPDSITREGWISDSTPTGDSRTWGYASSNWQVHLEAGDYTLSWDVFTPSTNASQGLRVFSSSGTQHWAASNTVFASAGHGEHVTTISSPGTYGVCVKTYDGVVRLKLEKGNVTTDWTPAPEDLASASDSVEYIVGTQAAATGSWTGVTKDSKLQAGKTIAYKLPYAGSGNATLNLTLADGTTTGAKNVKYNSNNSAANNVTTHYGAGSVIQMTYDGSVWRVAAGYYDTSGITNARYRTQWANAIKAETAITASRIICGTASGYKNIAASASFDLAYPLLYSTAAIAAGSTGTENYLTYNGINASNNGTITAGAANKMLYLKGTVDGNSFAIASSGFLTTNVPTTDDGSAYIPLGVMYSATNIYFSSSKELYCYKDGAFGPVSIREAAEAAKVAGNYIVETATNDVWVHSENHGPNSSGVATADTYGWRIGSVFELVRAGLSYFKMWVENSIAKVRVGLENAGHSVFSPSGMEVFTDSTTSVAQFGSTARVGESAKAHVNITGSATEFYAEDGSTKLAEITTYNSNPRFYIGQSGTRFMVTSGDSNTDNLIIGNYGYNNGQKEAAIELLAEGVGHTSFNVVSENIEGNDDEVFIGPSKAYFGSMDIKTEGAVYASKFGAIGTKQSDELSSSTSLTSGTTKAVASVSLAAGTWVVVGHAVIASNSSGVRSLGIGSTANSLSYTDLSCVTVRPASGADTRLQSTSIVSPTSTTTYYLNAYQNSGSSMNCTSAKLTAIRIA